MNTFLLNSLFEKEMMPVKVIHFMISIQLA